MGNGDIRAQRRGSRAKGRKSKLTSYLELRDVETSKRDPEAPKRAESSATERVSTDELFNASDELYETAVGKCRAEDDIGRGDAADLNIVPREHKSGKAETKLGSAPVRRQVNPFDTENPRKTQGSRVD